jgi:hypothetical protein
MSCKDYYYNLTTTNDDSEVSATVFSKHQWIALLIVLMGQPLARLFEGIIDAGVNTLELADIEYLQQLSHPENGVCVFHKYK